MTALGNIDNVQRDDVLAEINRADAAMFVSMLGGAVEHGAWIVARVASRRPFKTVDDIGDAIFDELLAASEAEQLTLLRGHPELAGAEANTGQMTEESTSEQGRLGLLNLSSELHSWLQKQNASYRAHHGFPYIVALWRHADLASVFSDLSTRLARTSQQELKTALTEVSYVCRARIRQILGSRAPTQCSHSSSSEVSVTGTDPTKEASS